MSQSLTRIRGAAENNLCELDVDLGPGLTAVVGVSGSGKSSLAFDTVYHEARRRFVDTLGLGSPLARSRPAAVRAIDGLGPAVSIAQNVLNLNPNSIVATAIGAHPFLRLLFSRFATVRCPNCGRPVRALSEEERLQRAVELGGLVEVPLVRGLTGSHGRLLAHLATAEGHAGIWVDGRPHRDHHLDPDRPHDITVRIGAIGRGARLSEVRAQLAAADACGSTEVIVGGVSLLRSPICPGCRSWVPPLPSTAFRPGGPAATNSHTIAGLTLEHVLALTPSALMGFLDEAGLAAPAARLQEELRRRLQPLVDLGLDHLSLDRSMPSLSRGESQRVRLAVVVAGRIEDLLHILDEPSIGLHRRDVLRLFKSLAQLPGPVLMVEHDAAAVASADDVVEVGPGAGTDGGRLVFQGTPARLWRADTVSGRFFARREAAVSRRRLAPPGDFIEIHGVRQRNLAIDTIRIPTARLTAVTGPSGAGKTTLVRDVLLASLRSGRPSGCARVEANIARALAVDQSPLGNNPRSNPATYTKVLDRIRDLFAAATGASPSMFTFNRPEGACPTCKGTGAILIDVRFLAPVWADCEACEGRRFRPESLALRAVFADRELSIADAMELTVDEALATFGHDAMACRILEALSLVGLGYLQLGRPSPSLSGGEAQRVKLARQLARARPGDLVLLDEPTTGLHPADLARLAGVLDGLITKGCTAVVVEHQPDLVAAADWIVELGPGGGPEGGRLIHCGPPRADGRVEPRPRTAPRRRPRSGDAIRIRGARANNLRDVDLDIPKGRITVVTGVSGSGKSSLVHDVLGAESLRRLLECLSMYERQGTSEGPESAVDTIQGLGPTLTLAAERRWATGSNEWLQGRRANVGSASGLDRHIAVLLARAGERSCLACGGGPVLRLDNTPDAGWRCSNCGEMAAPLEPRHLNPMRHAAACTGCNGRGYIRTGVVEQLIIRPDLPICGGAMRSPGYYPRCLCTPDNGGYAELQALARKYDFDPARTPWNEMTPAARRAFLHGDPEPMHVEFKHWPREARWHGVLTILSGSDEGDLFSVTSTCEQCQGRRLRREYLTVRLDGRDRHALHTAPLTELADVLGSLPRPGDALAQESLDAALARVTFLCGVGLGYVHLDRASSTLSAGEAQRIKLAALLAGELRNMTVLLDEPSRGLHPSEVAALAGMLGRLRDAGNTVVAVEHDPVMIGAADHIVEVGPGSGEAGGMVTYAGTRTGVRGGATAEALSGRFPADVRSRPRRAASGWMEVRGARAHDLKVDLLQIPLGVLTGVCGVSGSGKSTLVVDTIGRALAPARISTTVAFDPYRAGEHEAITGAPARTVVVDQTRAGIRSPGVFLGLVPALRRWFAESAAAVAAGVTEADFNTGCDACEGGLVVTRMGFLPAVSHRCEVCDGTGYRAEVRFLRARGRTIAEHEALSLEQFGTVWSDIPLVSRSCAAARELGLGYLAVRQPSWTLSGGEAQRLKLARELARRARRPSLHLLDEPTLGLHVRDVARLLRTLEAVVDGGHSVLVVEHDPSLLARCDWLIEMGPVGGPQGGRIIASGTPEEVARLDTPTAPYLRKALT